jgi:CheY-like chemotaxis protein
MPKIQIIDDDDAVVDMMAELLRVDGHQVVVATSAREGVELAFRERPDLILMDLFMPGMDGSTAVRMLKAAGPTRDIPIVAFTSAAQASDVGYLLAAGCVRALAKPVAPFALRRLLKELLG